MPSAGTACRCARPLACTWVSSIRPAACSTWRLAELRCFVTAVRGTGTLVGLAGALRLLHLEALVQLRSDFAGFRSAVCDGDRAGALDPQRLRELRVRLQNAAAIEASASRV